MADDYEKKSVNQIIQALDALSQTLSQARANRRSSPRALSRSASSKDRAVDAAAAEEASPRPRIWRRSAPTSPFRAKPKVDKIENNDGAEEDDDSANSAHSEQLKSRGFTAVVPEVAAVDGEKKARGPIRALSQNGMRRMGCLCSVEVVAAQGLPPSTNGLRLAVTVRKETRNGAVQTMTARVQLGAADFEEALYVRCHLYSTGGATTTSSEPRPFLLSLDVDAPELDMGRSTVDLSLFAKEFTEKCQQGESFQQWDMAIPLAGKAKGGELVIKLAFQSIDDGSAPKMTSMKTLKTDVAAPGLRGVDSFKLNDLEPEPTPIEEVKEMQHKEPERTLDDEHTPMAEVKEEEQQKEPKRELTDDEHTLVAEVDEQQKDPQHEPGDDESTPLVEMKEEEQQTKPECEPVDDEHTPLTEIKEEEQQKRTEFEPADDEHTLMAEVKEEEQLKEPECEPVNDEPTPLLDKEAGQQTEPEHEPANDEHTPVAEVEEEQQKESDCEPADVATPVGEVKEEEQQKELEYEPVDEATLVAEVKEGQQKEPTEHEQVDEPTLAIEVEKEQQKEPEHETDDEPTPVAVVKEEEQQKEPEHEPVDEPNVVIHVEEEEQQKGLEDVQEDDDSELPEFSVINKGIDQQEVKAELKGEAEARKGSEEEEEAMFVVSDKVAKAVANGLEEKSVEVTMTNDVSDAIADSVDLESMDAAAAQSEKVTEESFHVTEHGDKGKTAKPSRPPFKWRTVALLVPISVLFSKTLGAN